MKTPLRTIKLIPLLLTTGLSFVMLSCVHDFVITPKDCRPAILVDRAILASGSAVSDAAGFETTLTNFRDQSVFRIEKYAGGAQPVKVFGTLSVSGIDGENKRIFDQCRSSKLGYSAYGVQLGLDHNSTRPSLSSQTLVNVTKRYFGLQ